MMLRVSLDYLTVSIPLGTTKPYEVSWEQFIKQAQELSMSVGLPPICKKATPKWFELHAWVNPRVGARVAVNKQQDGAFLVAQFGGQALRSSGSTHELMQTIKYNYEEARITRFDVAVDVPDPNRTNWYAMSEEVVGNIVDDDDKKRAIFQSSKGNTLYFGSRRSPKFFRCYQKELGPDKKPHVRLEIECKPRSKIKLMSVDLANLLAIGVAEIKKRAAVEFPGQYEELGLSGLDQTEWQRVRWYQERNQSDREAWLYAAVLPAAQRLLEEDPEAVKDFATMLLAEYYAHTGRRDDMMNELLRNTEPRQLDMFD